MPGLTKFPGVSLDTDSTPTLEGESWLIHQAEDVANLSGVPATGCLVNTNPLHWDSDLGMRVR